MVKKIIYGGAVAALITSSAVFAGGPDILPPPVYFQGLYVGGTIGGHAAKVDQTANFSSNQTTIEVPTGFLDPETAPVLLSNIDFANADLNTGDINAYGGVQGGANWVWDSRWLVGIVGFWEGSHGLYADSSTNQQSTFVNDAIIPDGTSVTNTSNLTLNTQTKIGNDWGVAGKIGMLLSPTTLVYAKLGAIWADISTSASVNGSITGTTDVVSTSPGEDPITSTINTVTNVNGGTSSNEDEEVAFLVGGGLEQYVYSNVVTFFIEYNYAQFDSVSSGPVGVTTSTTGTSTVNGSTSTSISQGPTTDNASISASTNKVRFNNVLAGFNFYFGQNWL